MRYPTNNHRATSRYGRRELYSSMDFHSGQDYGCLDNQNPTHDPIFSIAPGLVRRVNNDKNGYGNYVVIEHGGYCTLYAHLHKVNVVQGQSVPEGFIIGTMGSTGATDSIHLHFEVRDVDYGDFWVRWEAIVHNGDREPYYAIDPELFFLKNIAVPVDEYSLVDATQELVDKLNTIFK